MFTFLLGNCCHHNMPNKGTDKQVTFHRFPVIRKWKKAWIVKIRRDVRKFFKFSNILFRISLHHTQANNICVLCVGGKRSYTTSLCL